MTQDIKHLPSLSAARKSTSELVEGASLRTEHSNDVSVLKEQLQAVEESIKFLQSEHASMLKGLHEEIERLQDLCRDLQFRCEAGGCLLPDSEFFQCSPQCLEQKVDDLIRENCDLKRRLSESLQAIDILDQKEKLALWQHHQELEQRDAAVLRLEKELEAKCHLLSSTSQGGRRKKGNFWRRFSFASSNHPSTSTTVPPHNSKVQQPRVDHLSKEDLPSEILQSMESQYQSYSSYSSLSDKSLSDDEGLGHSKMAVRLPPIAPRQLVRHQLRVNAASDSIAIDQMQTPEVKRLAS